MTLAFTDFCLYAHKQENEMNLTDPNQALRKRIALSSVLIWVVQAVVLIIGVGVAGLA
jgi:hypothetical protein